MKTSAPAPSLTLHDVVSAQACIASGIRRTPCHRLPDRPEFGGRELWVKRDDLQRTRSFKERGALNALLNLTPAQQERGVVAASAGNHAAGLAFHGGRIGIKVTVVVPLGAPAVKVARCKCLGAEVIVHGENFEAAQAFAEEFALSTGRALIHPFDDLLVIAGQATMGLEIIAEAPKFDAIVVPVGGGGLIAGVATIVKAFRPGSRVIGVQHEGAAFALSHQAGRPTECSMRKTLADGLAVARVGETSFGIAAPLTDGVVTVTEDEIAQAIGVLARCGIVAEGAGASGLAAALSGQIAGNRIMLPITGGNIEPRLHAQLVARVIPNALGSVQVPARTP